MEETGGAGARRDEPAPIGAEAGVLDRGGVRLLEAMDRLAACNVPHDHVVIAPGADEPAPVGTERHGVHEIVVPMEDPVDPSGVESDVAAVHDRPCSCHGGDGSRGARGRAVDVGRHELDSRPRVPEANGSVRPCSDDSVAGDIRRPRHRAAMPDEGLGWAAVPTPCSRSPVGAGGDEHAVGPERDISNRTGVTEQRRNDRTGCHPPHTRRLIGAGGGEVRA